MVNKPSRKDEKAALWVGRTLLAGVICAGVLLTIGLFIALGKQQMAPLDIGPIWRELPAKALAGDGVAILDLGLLVLMITPAARVAVLAAAWLYRGEKLFACVASIVLTLLVLSIGMGSK